MTDRNNGETTGRKPDGTFGAGNPGRPRGARHKVTRAMEDLLEGESQNITRKAVDMALEGDITAIRLCMERLIPARKSKPISIDLPKIERAEDVAAAMSAVVVAVSDGEIDPDEGETLSRVIEVKRKSLETVDLESRLSRLEELLKGKAQ